MISDIISNVVEWLIKLLWRKHEESEQKDIQANAPVTNQEELDAIDNLPSK